MLRIIDPLTNTITLTKECWENHICVVHVEMKARRDEIQKTIADPDFIYRSKSSSHTRLYFRRYVEPTLNCEYILVAVRRRASETRGFVQSAYPVKSLSKGGVLEWKKK